MTAPLDPVVHQASRLLIMGALHRNRRMTHADLCIELGLTDGNLAAHARRLAEAGYVQQVRAFEGRSFRAVYRITPAGDAAFIAYVEGLQRLLEGLRGPRGEPSP